VSLSSVVCLLVSLIFVYLDDRFVVDDKFVDIDDNIDNIVVIDFGDKQRESVVDNSLEVCLCLCDVCDL